MRSPPSLERFLAEHLQLYQQIGGRVRRDDTTAPDQATGSTTALPEPERLMTGGSRIVDLARGSKQGADLRIREDLVVSGNRYLIVVIDALGPETVFHD